MLHRAHECPSSFSLLMGRKRKEHENITCCAHTSAVRAFCPDYFPHFVSGLEPRHIGARRKGTPFCRRLSPEAIYPLLCLD